MKLFFILFVFLLTSCAPAKTSSPLAGETTFLLDTVVRVDIYGMDQPDKATKAIRESFDLCANAQKLWSRTVETSEISHINQAQGQPVAISEKTKLLLQKALSYSVLSSGAFDCTIAPVSQLWDFKKNPPQVPDPLVLQSALSHVGYQNILLTEKTAALSDPLAQIDLGGIAKGAIADEMAEFLQEQGVTSAIINLGGNIYGIGKNVNGAPFSIGIQKPFSSELIGTIQVENSSVVTSGTYERYFKKDGILYHHILDPKTGYPADNGLDSVTILSEKSVDGDALSTACFVLGEEKGAALIESLAGMEAVFVRKDGSVFLTSGAKNKVRLTH